MLKAVPHDLMIHSLTAQLPRHAFDQPTASRQYRCIPPRHPASLQYVLGDALEFEILAAEVFEYDLIPGGIRTLGNRWHIPLDSPRVAGGQSIGRRDDQR